MGTFDSWGVNSFISLYLIQAVALSSENLSNYKYQWFIAVIWRIYLSYICLFAVWRFFLVKLLRLPPNRKPCDFIKAWLWIDQKIRQITDISDLLLLFDEFLFLTFASLQSDDFFSETFKTSSKQKAFWLH